MVRNYYDDAKWIAGTVMKKLGPVTYSVNVGDGQTMKRHIDQFKALRYIGISKSHDILAVTIL